MKVGLLYGFSFSFEVRSHIRHQTEAPNVRGFSFGLLNQSYLVPSLPSCFLISGLSYKTTFNRELLISSFPLYLM